jgi:hypothetical protein
MKTAFQDRHCFGCLIEAAGKSFRAPSASRLSIFNGASQQPTTKEWSSHGNRK